MPKQPLLLETIRLIDGKMPHLTYHQQRLQDSLWFHYGEESGIDLAREIQVPESCRKGLYKLRITYGPDIREIEIEPYAVRPVNALQICPIANLDYAYKYADRRALLALFDQRTFGDDILMVRNGLITDTSYANVALYDGDRWYTPAQPLLPGTARARYLEGRQLQAINIHLSDLKRFQKLKLINAMMAWEEGPEVEIQNIRF